VGSGGREHALAWKLAASPGCEKVFTAPGNGGTAEVGENVPVADTDVQGLVAFARREDIGLVVPGPEAALVAGLADALAEADIPCFGPVQRAAMLEGSKVFAKRVMQRAGVPTGAAEIFDDPAEARKHIDTTPGPWVVKADGLAAGKGVTVARDRESALAAIEEAMVARRFGDAGDRVLVEELLEGEEASFLAFCDGRDILLMPSSQDHKPVGEGDTGPNTGGMGAYSPAPILPESEYARVADMVLAPIVRQMAAEGAPFKGVLYAGLMKTREGWQVLEYNVRFGDPECQPLLMRLDSDLLEILLACANGRARDVAPAWKPETGLCLVLASEGYPGDYEKGKPITGLAAADQVSGVKVFQAGTRSGDKGLVTAGGRVLGVTALGRDLAQAKKRAYEAADRIRYQGKYCRGDIGDKGLARNI
jgi:phosphoribosylamine--glycine ligase